MVYINKATATVKLSNVYYKTIINAKYDDQTNETITELGQPIEDEWSCDYELSRDILVVLWK